VKEVLDKKVVLVGLDQVKRKMSQMPEGSRILWSDELYFNGRKQKGSDILKYPPPEMVQEILRYARSRNIQMIGPFNQGSLTPPPNETP